MGPDQRIADRLTDRARQVIEIANREANILGDSCIGTDLILFGLLEPGLRGVAGAIWERLKLDTLALRATVIDTRRLASGDSQEVVPTGIRLPLSHESLAVLKLAEQISDEEGWSYIGTESLAVALVHETSGISQRLLTAAGATTENMVSAMRCVVGIVRPSG